MFTKLKRKFIIVYTFSIIILLVFFSSVIFYTSYRNARAEVKMQLEIKDNKNGRPEGEGNPIFDDDEFGSRYHIFGEDIYMILDNDGNITEVLSQRSFSQDEIEDFQKNLNKDDNKVFKVDGNYYAYVKYDSIVKLKNITHVYTGLRELLLNLIIFGILIIIVAVILGNFLASKALEPIKESFDKQKVFVSDASHELKTPLSVISSCLELIKEGDDESDKWIDYCISETDRLKSLTSTLLTLSKDSSNFNKEELEAINISEQLDLLVCAYEVKLFEDKYELETSIEEDIMIRILGDDFKQMFHILMDNAIKYSDSRQNIIIKLKKEHKSVEFMISNTSDFINQKDIDKIFDRFYRQDVVRSKKVEGFGLGLSLVKAICEKYKIKYEVKYEDSMMKFKFHFIES